MSEIIKVKPADLIRRLRRLATTRGWVIEVEEAGSHTKVTLNGRRSTVPRHAKDMGAGLLQAIRKQLGLLPEDLRQQQCGTPTPTSQNLSRRVASSSASPTRLRR